MVKQAQVSYHIVPSQTTPHVAWIDLYGDGVLHECAIVKQNADGNLAFFAINSLDDIDRRRLAGVLHDRNVASFELWDLLSQKTLGNGVNALTYFHQLVKVLTPAGKIVEPKLGQVGGLVTGAKTTAVPIVS